MDDLTKWRTLPLRRLVETFERLRVTLASWNEERTRLEEARRRLQDEIARAQAELAAIKGSAGLSAVS